MVFVVVALVRSSDGTASDASATSTPVTVEAPGLEVGTTASLGGKELGEGVAEEVSGRTPLRGFGEVAATITTEDGRVCEVCLMAATDAAQRERGLMEVTDEDLGGYDGMLFEYDGVTNGSFWMRNTPMPLSIAYFDDEGRVVATADMEPCSDSPNCPGYPAGKAFRYALEVPQGMLDEIGAEPGATLAIRARTCPLAKGGG